MAQEPKKIQSTDGVMTVKKSDLAKLKKSKADGAKAQGVKQSLGVKQANEKNAAQTAISPAAKRKNEIIERRQKALAQAQRNQSVKKQQPRGKDEKPVTFFGKVKRGFVNFGKWVSRKFKETVSELKKVTWPERKEAFKQTLVVLAVVASFLVVLFVMDLGLSNLLKLLAKAAESAA
jgi:preprotein translocase subunit SecE